MATKKSPKKPVSKKSPAAAPKKGFRPSKADFIRSLPPNTPASEVVAKAKAVGINVTAAYVYVLRSNAKIKAAKGKPKAGSVDKSRKGQGVKVSRAGWSAEMSLRKAVAELGLSKAREIFAAVEEAFKG